MSKTPYEPVVINITDFIAFLVKKVIVILIICVICTVLAIGIHYFMANKEKAIEKYNLELEEYSSTFNAAKNKLDSLVISRDNISKSMKEDPAISLFDSGAIFVSNLSFFIRSEDDVIVSDSGSLIYPNQEKLSVFFDSIDMSKVLGVDSKKEYLNKLILFSAQRNHIEITAYNNSKESASNWAEKVYDVLSEYSNNQGWEISDLNSYTESYYGPYINDIVDEYNDSLADFNKKIIEQTRAVKDLSSRQPHPYHFLRFAVIGFVLGGFISVLAFFIRFVQMNFVTRSFTVENKTGKQFLGSFWSSGNIFDKLARRIIGERKFSSESEASEFIKGNIRNTSLKDNAIKNVAILCSCKSKDVEKQAKSLESVLSEFCCKATLVTDISVNPESADVVSSTDAVILLERQWVSQWKLVGVSIDLAERFDKPVVGFVLC